MATNLALDDHLILEAVRVGHHRSKRAAVTEALKEYVARHKQQRIISLFGKVEYGPHYNYKKERARVRST